MIDEATFIASPGPARLRRKVYERVLLTWGSGFTLGAEHDQFMVWINHETRMIEKAAYTARAFAGFASPP